MRRDWHDGRRSREELNRRNARSGGRPVTAGARARESAGGPPVERWDWSALALLAGVFWLLSAATASAQDGKSVLLIYSTSAELPAVGAFESSLRSTVTKATRQRVEFYDEYLDIPRFPELGQRDAFLELLRSRYADRKIDAVVLGGPGTIEFMLGPGAGLFPEIPLVYTLLQPDRIEAATLSDRFVGVTVDFEPLPTISLALRLHPSARRVVLVTGAGPWGSAWERRLRQDTAGLPKGIEREFLSGLTTAELLARLRALPGDAVVFTPGYFHDGTRLEFIPRDTVVTMAGASAAPIYVPYETQMDSGAVGGVIPTWDAVGRETGAIVASLVAGKAPAALDLPKALPGAPLIDWRQVRRWGIDEDLLPAGSVVRYREPDPWEQHWREISIAMAIVALQAALIIGLLIERRMRHRIATELEASEMRMDLAARAANLTTWIWDAARDRVCSVARSRGDGHGKAIGALSLDDAMREVHPADRARVEHGAREALETGRDLDIEYRTVHEDGETRWIALRGGAERRGGARLLGVALDVTERKRSELQAERDRAALRHMARVSMLGQLSASIAHELNQPLTSILSNAEAAQLILDRDPVNTTELRKICNDIVTEDSRAADVIVRLRSLFQRGKLELETIDLNELIGETLDLVSTQLLMQQIMAVTELAPSPPFVEGGRVELQQVLLNLIMNAVDAMSGGAEDGEERRIVIRTELTGENAQICVTDRGPGIPAAVLDELFEPFRTSKPGGMGMGLAICRSIVSAHRGTLTAANNSERGAMFCVTLPARQAG